jgi:ABC-type transporter Mla subunit MlaD
MQIDDNGLPIHTNAQAFIRPRIFLEGNFFVDLHPGSPSAPKLGDGDTISIQNTRSPVQLDQILTSLQANTRHNLQILLEEYSTALKPPGSTGYNASIPYWEPAYKNSAIVNQATLGLKAGDLPGYIREAGTVAEALDANPAQLQSLITDFSTTAAAFSQSQSSLEQTVAELPRTLHAAQPAFNALNQSFPALRSLIADFRPAVRSSGPAIDASLPFITQARKLVSKPELRGLVADLVPTVPSLAALNNASVPLYNQVRAASSCQNDVILPWTKLTVPDPNFPAKHNVAGEAPKPLPGLAGEGRSASPNGFWFRVLGNEGEFIYDLGRGNLVTTALPLLGTNPPKAPLRPDVPCETQPVPGLKTTSGAPPGRVQSAAEANPAAYKAMWNKLAHSAVGEIRSAFKGKNVKVSSELATPADIAGLAARTGHTGQLNEVQELLQHVPVANTASGAGK